VLDAVLTDEISFLAPYKTHHLPKEGRYIMQSYLISLATMYPYLPFFLFFT